MNEEKFEKINSEEIIVIEEEPKKRNKKPITKIVAVVTAIALSTGVFATGYFMGSDKLLAGIISAEQAGNEIADADYDEALEEILDERKEDNRVELTTQEIAKLVGPAVVGIVSQMEVTDYFWGTSGVSEASGSGIIFKKNGNTYYVMTNNHVVDGASKVSVQVAGDKTFESEIVGTDANTDLAVLKLTSTEELTVAKLGDSNKVEVGERAIAIGNPLGMEFFGSVTQGIISATNRKVQMSDNFTMNYLQTDAAINNGNSGGALVNAYGEVIGVNSAKISTSVAEGMGFAIPISEAEVVAEDLVHYGYVKGRPVIGITTVDVTESIAKRYGWPQGIWVNSVQRGSGAEAGGLMRGDIIIEANGTEVKTVNELNNIKNKLKPGDKLKLKVYRENKGNINITITLSEDNPINSK